MPIELGMALKLLGGAPHLKAGSFIAENLPIAKVLDGGPIGELLATVVQNGPAAVMQNPIAAVTGQLQGAIGAAVSALGSIPGAAGLASAIAGPNGLASAVSGLSAAADLLSGVAMPDDGEFGLLDVVTHTSITDMLGDAMPASMGLDHVLGPIYAGTAIAGVAAELPSVIARVNAGSLGVADAMTWVSERAAMLRDIVTGSSTALQSAQDAAALFASVSATAALLAVPTDPALLAILPQILPADALAEMRSAVASHLA